MILWRDRKRILGMPITFTVYSLSEDRLFIKTGLFNLRTEEIILYRIRDISLRRSFGQRIFGVGTLTLFSVDQSCPRLLLKSIKNPEKLHRYLSDFIEKTRQSKGVAGREIVGMAGVGLHHSDDGDGDSVPEDAQHEQDADVDAGADELR